ncbi:hypothetical protein EG358_16635 [Chryseobacterium indoltheticum]|nr:hypothetical protein EG358_16635 [Chryseobacterium indoltheticum]
MKKIIGLIFILYTVFYKIMANVLGLCDGGAIEAQIFNFDKSSIEELPLNFAVSPHYCKTLVVRLCFSNLFFRILS